ncbi:putative flagellar protein [Gottschalkia purinilytica]|uniref:Putative flagellar protein n=1 Tax=Gottschalkia purinilytica TaxID=1503 RepID=A0A0L0WBK9_GOTPU|nr:flagellar biosynthetic protein FliO [Gottschalkia purinilytica]KNF08827.1 putative flagellar protein [Gottschalkia purinilytica]
MRKNTIVLAINLVTMLCVNNISFAFSKETNTDSSIFLAFFKIIGLLIVFGIIILLTFYCTKFIAQKTNYLAKSKNIELLDSISLDGNGGTKISIIKIQNYIYVLLVGNNTSTLIDKFHEDDISIESIRNKNINTNKNFDKYLEALMNKDKINEMSNKLKNLKTTLVSKTKKDKDNPYDKE